MPTSTVLVVDDDAANLQSLSKILQREGFAVLTASNAEQALLQCRQQTVDVVLTDLMMPGMSGLELLHELSKVASAIEVVLMTAYGTIEVAVEAMRQGAYDFVEKPLKRLQIVKSIRKAVERRALLAENRHLKQELSALRQQRPMVGNALAFRRALELATQAAPSTANVLVLGESGTGKELLARHIHEHSRRRGTFVAVNLSALPETIVEAELFGYEKGAFTGANSRREGRIAQAEEGTLFLDEIGELSPLVQVKLLRLLQEGEYEPLGGTTQSASFRLIAATHRDLRAAIDAGEFRADLFYRLHVIDIVCPPLRHRREDIPLLAEHFLAVYSRKNHKSRMTLSPAALQHLMAYDWPGNVRELENVIERAVVLAREAELQVADLPDVHPTLLDAQAPIEFRLGMSLAEVERHLIAATLSYTGGDKQRAAQLLGISARTIYRKLEGVE